jgi:hypothetical protein
LAADDVEIDAKLPRVGDAVFAAELEAEVRNAGQMIAGKDVDGSGDGVGKGVERRRQRQGILEGGVDRGEVRLDIPAIPLVRRLRLDSLAQRIAAVLKKFMPDDRACDIDDVIGVERAINAEAPVQQAFGDVVVAADAGLEVVRDHFAVCFRIAPVDSDVGSPCTSRRPSD